MVLNLKQMTAVLARISPETPATLNRQIRAWTDAGVLPLVGDLRTGTGRGRLYEDDAPLFGALAIELTRFGADIGLVQDAVRFLHQAFNNPKDPWGRQLKKGEARSNMIVMPSVDGTSLDFAFMRPDQLGDYIGGPDFDATGNSILVINLRGLWAKLA